MEKAYILRLEYSYAAQKRQTRKTKKMTADRGQGQDCRDIGGCIIQISYRQDRVHGRYIASGTRPCMRCMNNVWVVVND